MHLLLLPCATKNSVAKIWHNNVKKFLKEKGKLTPRQRAHLARLDREVDRRRKRKTTKIYAAGMYTNNMVPASRGKRVKLMPFGTWYFSPSPANGVSRST